MNCDIIKDLLPLYCDGVCSEETSRAVEEHLTTCPVCRALLDEMQREPVMPELIQTQAKQEAKVLQGVKRKFSLRRRLSVLAVALVDYCIQLGKAFHVKERYRNFMSRR